jgi:hypothetical protein
MRKPKKISIPNRIVADECIEIWIVAKRIRAAISQRFKP